MHANTFLHTAVYTIYIHLLWSSTIIFVLVSSEVPGNCTSNDAATSSAQHEPRASKLIKERRTIGTSLLENLPRDVNETNEFSFNITKESHENGNLTEYQFRDDVAGSYRDYNNYMPDIAADNFAETKSSNYTALHERHEDPLNKSSKINAKCDSNICIPLCCPLGNRLIEERCVTGEGNYSFPIVHGTNATSNSSRADEIVVDKRLDEMFQLIVDDPCQKAGRFLLNESNNLADDEYWFLDNGSLYQPRRQKFIHPKSYCLALVDQDRYDVTVVSAGDGRGVHHTTGTAKYAWVYAARTCQLAVYRIYNPRDIPAGPVVSVRI